MGFQCGIVGLPNVGKSTLFNALTQSALAQAANYPFSTIDPNVGEVAVPDPRLEQVGRVAGSAEIVPTKLSFVDIAGLVRGASRGEGLGNQFLAHVREMDALAHVLRCFEDADVAHVETGVDPIRDAEIVDTELMLADLESLERRLEPLEKRERGGDKEAAGSVGLIRRAIALLSDGKPARLLPRKPDEEREFQGLALLTAKPVLYVCNVDEPAAATGNAHSAKVEAKAKAESAGCVVISAKIEAEIALLPAAEQAEYLATLGLREPGLHRLIRAGYALLDLVTFFTPSAKYTHAWTVVRGTKAPQAAGAVHSDFEKGFVRAETVGWQDFVALGGEAGARDAGKLRLEGKDYVVQDGDVMRFRFAA